MHEQFTNGVAPVESANILLDLSDPIDAILIDFKKDVACGNLPTAEEQLRLTMGVQRMDTESARALIRSHRGLVAAVAYGFKATGTESRELLLTGTGALIEAAETYSIRDSKEFNDHAIAIIGRSLAIYFPFPEVSTNPADTSQPRPIERFTHLMDDLQDDARLEDQRRQAAKGLQELLQPHVYRMLTYLHLPESEIGKLTGLTTGSLRYAAQIAKDKLGVQTREGVALAALERGVQFDIKRVPRDTEFSMREKDVVERLALRNSEIQDELQLSKKQVNLTVASLLRKTSARTRVELTLMGRSCYFKPAKEEIEPYPEVLEEFTPRERRVLQLLHLPAQAIADRLTNTYKRTITRNSVYDTISRARDKTDTSSVLDLTMELYRRGLRYDIREPKRPLVELMDSDQMRVIESLELPYKVISEANDIPVTDIEHLVWHMKQKTGARSRQELVLMMKAFDTGERRDPVHTPKEKLAAKLGIQALTGCNIELVAKYVREHDDPGERDLLSTYYLTDEPVIWRDVAAQLGVHAVTARSKAQRGVHKIRRRLDTEYPRILEPVAASSTD
jgi:DNA-binding CsgD family transcriptional regulator